MHYDATVYFFPVGQGLFSYGQVNSDQNGKEILSWVYDCGTVSGKDLVNDSIDSLASKERSRIDVVFISHFDKDHISGIIYLLKKFDVSLLVMPYFSAFDISISFVEGSIDVEELNILIDPVSFFSGNDFNVDNIVFLNYNEDGLGDEGAEPVNVRSDDEMVLFFQGRSIESNSNNIKVYSKKNGHPIQANSVWIFFVHNARFVPKLSKCLLDRIKEISLNPHKLKEKIKVGGKIKNKLDGIKADYSKELKNNSKNKNIISTYVYAKPVKKHSMEVFSCSFKGLYICSQLYKRILFFPYKNPFQRVFCIQGMGI